MKRAICMMMVLIFAFVFVLAGCGGAKQASVQPAAPEKKAEPAPQAPAEEKKVELTFWHCITTSAGSYNVIDEMIKAFQAKNPNITVKPVAMNVDDMRNTIKQALASKSGPDVMYYDAGPGYMGVLAKAGMLMDLTPMYEKSGLKSKIPAWIQERTTSGGKQYGVGNSVEMLGVYYNKKIFKDLGVEVPKTWDEFIKVCEAAKAKNITPVSLDDKDQWPGFHQESIYYTAVAGKAKIDDVLQKKAGFDQPEFAEALDLLGSMVKKGYTTKNPNSIGYDDGNKEFFTGKAAMRMTGTWMVASMVDNLKEDVGFFILPPYKAGLPLSAPGGVGGAMIAAANTEKAEQTQKFIEFAFSDDGCKIWLQGSIIPPVKIDNSSIKMSNLFKEVFDLANTPAGLSYSLDVLMPQGVNDVTMNFIQEILAGKKTGQEAAKIKQKALQEAIDKGEF